MPLVSLSHKHHIHMGPICNGYRVSSRCSIWEAHSMDTSIDKMQSNTTINIYIAKRCYYIAGLNDNMFRPLYRPSRLTAFYQYLWSYQHNGDVSPERYGHIHVITTMPAVHKTANRTVSSSCDKCTVSNNCEHAVFPRRIHQYAFSVWVLQQ